MVRQTGFSENWDTLVKRLSSSLIYSLTCETCASKKRTEDPFKVLLCIHFMFLGSQFNLCVRNAHLCIRENPGGAACYGG